MQVRANECIVLMHQGFSRGFLTAAAEPEAIGPPPMANSNTSIRGDIENLVKARYPLLYIISAEEKRVEENLVEVCRRTGLNFRRWSITEGLRDERGQTVQEAKDPLKVLAWLSDTTEQCMLVLRDFHPFLKDFTVVRRLRDLHRSLPFQRKHAVLLSPTMAVPNELSKEISLIDYPLPDAVEISDIVDQIARSVQRNHGTELRVLSYPEEKRTVVDAALGLTRHEIEAVMAKSLVERRNLEIDVILSEKEQIIRKSGTLEYYHPKEHFNDIGGLDNLKIWLEKRKRAFSTKAQDFGLPKPRGILLLGVPGCGKSLTAKAVGAFWQLPLLRLDVGRLYSSYVGSSEENMRSAIKIAESVAPSILWLDELEKGFSGSASSGMSDGGTTSRVFGSFITWLQEKTAPVFVLATANNVTQMPPELLRKGRFDEIFFVDLPSAQEREEVLRIHIRKRNRSADDFDIKAIGDAMQNFSGSEIEQVVVSALYDAFEQDRPLNTEHLLQAAFETVPLARTMKEEIEGMREWARVRARRASTLQAEHEQSSDRRIDLS